MLVEFEWKRTRRYNSSYISILFLSFALLALIFSDIMNAFVGLTFIVGNEMKTIDSLEQLVEEKDIIPVIIGGGSLENELRVRKLLKCFKLAVPNDVSLFFLD
jgi:hypothetical protein